MPSADQITIPEDSADALRLATDAVAKAAGAALWDTTSLPPDWYVVYGQVQQIMTSLESLATAAVDNMPRGIIDRDVYVDELGEGKTPEVVIGEWIVRTNAAIFYLDKAAGQWAAAHSALGRLGVRDDDESDEV